ncbi:unnamed protein product [Cyclocybe aegerita]|uniref:F-box domain-containing protein n=1 Tax=Cyclocybe aegerita TaxID=1973307 RepID=A0A8S0VY85_CYCAE|nr:unnamed protein product [Cyclocybe aegerita]
MPSSSPSLPQELIIEIMNRLDSHSILQMALTCRCFYAIFQSTPIRYVYELGMNSLQDAGSGMPTDELLVLLRDRQKAWATLEWKSLTTVKVPPSRENFKRSAGVLARLDRDELLSSIYHLPPNLAPGSGRSDGILWRVNSASIFTAARSRRTKSIPTQLRPASLTHLLSSQPRILLVDNVLALCVENIDLIRLWNWTTDLLLFDSFNHVLRDYQRDLRSFEFLRRDAFIVTSETESGQILVYRFSPTTPGIPVHVASFGLPPTAPSFSPGVYLRLGQFQPRSTPGMLFTHLPESRVLCFVLAYPYRMYSLYVCNSTFLMYVDNSGAGASGVQDVPWEVWGEKESRFMEGDFANASCLDAHGSRVIYGFSDKSRIEVLDFSSIQPCFASPIGRQYGSSNPTIVSYKEVFIQDVVTRLPYWVVSRAMEEESFNRNYMIMIDEEHIIALDTSDIRVYSF